MKSYNINKKVYELNNSLNNVLSNFSNIQVLDVNDEKENLLREILDLENSIKKEIRNLKRSRNIFLEDSVSNKPIIDENKVNIIATELESKISLLNEKINQYNCM